MSNSCRLTLTIGSQFNHFISFIVKFGFNSLPIFLCFYRIAHTHRTHTKHSAGDWDARLLPKWFDNWNIKTHYRDCYQFFDYFFHFLIFTLNSLWFNAWIYLPKIVRLGTINDVNRLIFNCVKCVNVWTYPETGEHIWYMQETQNCTNGTKKNNLAAQWNVSINHHPICFYYSKWCGFITIILQHKSPSILTNIGWNVFSSLVGFPTIVGLCHRFIEICFVSLLFFIF